MPELVVPTVVDAARVAAVINDRAIALDRATEESAAGVARWFSFPFIGPAADMRLALADDGSPVGYADVSGPEDDTPRAWIDLRALSGDRAAVELLFAWAQERGAERAGACGEIQAFRDHWGYVRTTFEAWSAQNLGDGEDISLWRVAWDGEQIAGVSINRPRRGEDETVGWVNVLAVRRPWRRRGLGEALLRESFGVFAERGKRAAGLDVDAENTTGAVALYERVGMHGVRRSDTWQRTA